MNKIKLTGWLTDNPDVRATRSGKMVADFTIAVPRITKDAQGRREKDYIKCIVWGQAADYASKYLKNRQLIGVSGRLQMRKYEADNGKVQYFTEVVVDQLEPLSKAPALEESQEETMGAFGEEIPF
ncbi:MAG: single-stranded DNA-binding protein [Acholeplasmataceae bacterium]|nr:single-stranded DNA-binding protein [Acholeplasmataceae bacterium]